MRDYPAFRQNAIRYWERRRIVYNLALVPPALLGYGLTDTLNWAGDTHEMHYGFLLLLFTVSALGANICYSLAYALEFVFGHDDPASSWMRRGRTWVFAFGVAFGMFLAFIGGWDIANLEWNHRFNHV